MNNPTSWSVVLDEVKQILDVCHQVLDRQPETATRPDVWKDGMACKEELVRICWSNIPHSWKSHVAAQLLCMFFFCVFFI